MIREIINAIRNRRKTPFAPPVPDYADSVAYLARASARGDDVSDAIAVLHGMVGGSITDMAEDVEASAAFIMSTQRKR